MSKIRMTRTQLRRVIEEAMIGDSVPPRAEHFVNDFGDALGMVIVELLRKNSERIVADFMRENPNDEMFRPGRYEDKEAFSKAVAERAWHEVEPMVELIADRIFAHLMSTSEV